MRQEPSIEAIEYAPLPPLRRSGVGIASFCVGVAAAATLIAVISAIEGRRATDMMVYKLLGATFVVPAVGTVLGSVSMFQRRRYRGLPVAGLAINVILGLLWLLITVPSLLHELSR